MDNPESSEEIRQREKRLARSFKIPIDRQSGLQDSTLSKKEATPDKNYDELSIRLPYNVKLRFVRICSKFELKPSAQARKLVTGFVEANASLLDE